jgi:hypothetical protein
MFAPFVGRIYLSQGLGPLEGLPYSVKDRAINARSRGCSLALRARLFRRRGRARGGGWGLGAVTAGHGPLVTAP